MERVGRIVPRQRPGRGIPSHAAMAVTVPAPTRREGGPGRLRALDGLRLLVALMVASFHYLGKHDASKVWGQDAHRIFPNVDLVASYGWLGVEIFFVISGFVICMSSWGKTLGAFVRSRICRLYPAYWAGVVLTFLVLTVAPALPTSLTVGDAVVNMTMFQAGLGAPHVDGVYWTLWVELRFYLIFALVIRGGLSYQRVVVFCAIWTAAIPIAGAADTTLLTFIVQPDYASFFLIGIGFYLLHRFGNQLLTWIILGANGAIALFRLQSLTARAEKVVGMDVHFSIVAVVLLATMAFLMALAWGRLDWMNWSWLTVAGSLSYPFYLLHENIGYSLIHVMYRRFGISAYVVLPVTVLAILLLSWLVHRFVERPVAGVLKRQLGRPSLLDPPPRLGKRGQRDGPTPR